MEKIGMTLVVMGSAILLAAAVATLLQLRRTLRGAEAFLEALSPRLNRALEDASAAFARMDSAATRIEKGAAELQVAIERARSLADTMEELGASLHGISRITGVVGRAIATAFSALRAGRGSARPDPPAETS